MLNFLSFAKKISILFCGFTFFPAYVLLATNFKNYQAENRASVFLVNKDTFLSSVGHEVIGNNGAGRRLKIKGPQEYTLFDVDIASLSGKVISKAMLHIRSATPAKEPLGRVSISSVASQCR
jgi:hypothetical protein